jgi:hypothetical protein
MTAAPICVSCDLERTLVTKKPVKNRHEMRQYECPGCRNVFSLVTQRVRMEFDDLTVEWPLQAAAQ